MALFFVTEGGERIFFSGGLGTRGKGGKFMGSLRNFWVFFFFKGFFPPKTGGGRGVWRAKYFWGLKRGHPPRGGANFFFLTFEKL